MTAPGEPEPTPELREEEQEIVLRLGDILPRVPAHLLKPGPHDTMSRVRFSVDELAEKISRGRVSVPLERLASVCPEVFRDSAAFEGEQEIQLPLQKLLEQVGLVAPKPPAPNGIPQDQIDKARAEAGRIIEAASSPSAPSPGPAFAVPPEDQANRAPQPARMARAISTARQILGLFTRSSEPAATEEKSVDVKPPGANESTPASSAQPAPVSPAEPAPPGCISLRVLPIFRLLPAEVLRQGTLPSEDARIALPLAAIDPQLASGHVDIPLDDFVKALPDDLRQAINPVPDTQVWIPLDEIFQSLPPDHLFYMPPLDALPEPASNPAPELPSSGVPLKPIEAPAVVEAPATSPEPAKPAEPVENLASDPSPAPSEPVPPETPPTLETAPVSEPSPEPPPSAPQEIPLEVIAASTPVGDPPAAETVPPIEAPPQTAPEPAAAPASSRAPWMRGFQVPPPRLFTGSAPAEAPPEPASADPTPPAAPTPEARRTADFLASQPGIFAAAAFVEGAVFASADFPRKPDLDALRDFMGAFVDHARESGRRLGWNRVLTIACEQFHATAVARDTHFIVALHHDRVLPTLTHDALIAAADDLSNTGG